MKTFILKTGRNNFGGIVWGMKGRAYLCKNAIRDLFGVPRNARKITVTVSKTPFKGSMGFKYGDCETVNRGKFTYCLYGSAGSELKEMGITEGRTFYVQIDYTPRKKSQSTGKS